MSQNFMRRYVMRCGPSGKHGFVIGNLENAFDTALHISFSIEKSDSESPNNAKVQIWNLSNENIKVVEGEKSTLELKAGYGDNTALILVGSIASAITTLDGADRMTEVEIVDGLLELKETDLSISINGKVDCKELYQTIADRMGVSIVFAKDLTFKVLPNGFSYIGKAKNALQKVAKACGHKWTIQNGVLQITVPGRAITTKGYLLNSETGLIGIPKRISIGSGDDAKQGWEIEYFLNGAIGINDIVQINSSSLNGYFRVHKITIDGDNLEGDWTCTAQVLEIKQQGKLDKKASKK